jgi:hypothetical protein
MFNVKIGSAYRSGYCDFYKKGTRNPYSFLWQPRLWLAYIEGRRNARVNQKQDYKRRKNHVRFY